MAEFLWCKIDKQSW